MERWRQDAKIFKALCDPKRLAILEQLRSGEKCACVLQEPLDLTQSELSYHMKILCDSGLVTSRQEGKWTHYRLSASGGALALERLRAILTPDTAPPRPLPGLRQINAIPLRWRFFRPDSSKLFDMFCMESEVLPYGCVAIFSK